MGYIIKGSSSGGGTASAITTVAASHLVGRGSAAGDGNSQDITLGTGLSMSGTTLNGTAGVTNSAGTNVLPKSDSGGNLVASSVTDDGTTVTVNAATTVRSAALPDGTAGFVNIAGALPIPNSGGGYASGLRLLISTPSTTGTRSFFGIFATLSGANTAGYTNSAAQFDSTTTGSGLNYGVSAFARGATALGINTGVYGEASYSATSSRGVVGYVPNGSAVTGEHFGVLGMGAPGGSSTFAAGAFSLGAAAPSLSGVYTALLADNGAIAVPIAIFRDNGTPQLTIEDGGYLTGATGGVAGTVKWGIPAASPQAYTHTVSAGGVGTDIVGATATIQPGPSTGSAAPSDLNLAVGVTGTTGTTAQPQINKFMLHNKVYSMPDDTDVSIFSVDLPTSNTGAVVHLSFTYTVTNGSNAGVHGGIFVIALVNNGGTVSGSVTDSGEAVAGTGAGAGIDTESVTVVGTVATFKVKFNNTLSATGSFTCQVLNNSAANFTWL